MDVSVGDEFSEVELTPPMDATAAQQTQDRAGFVLSMRSKLPSQESRELCIALKLRHTRRS